MSPPHFPSSSASHRFRRLAFRVLHPIRFRRLQAQRRETTRYGNTCRPFDERHCIFVHIPKCAGIAVCQSLFGVPSCGHKPLRLFQIMYSPEEFRSYFKFTVVRNPWDRLVSAYCFLKDGGINERNRLWAEANLAGYENFGAFVHDWVNPKNIQSSHHFTPQCDFICIEKNRPAVDFIGRHERLAEDFARICERLNVKATLQAWNKGQSRARDYREYYTPETRRIVAEVYADDIELLGYEF